MRKGSIVLIPFPFTDLSGHKIRPALVLHEQKGGEECIVSFISSVNPAKLGQYEIKLVPSKENGIKVDSTIRVSKIATLQKKIVIGALGELEPMVLMEVDKKLRKLFEI